MPIYLSKVSSVPDILSAHRHQLMFGEIPGYVGGEGPGKGGEGLMIKEAHVQIPELAIGQVRVPVLGYPIAFAGSGVDHQNQFTVDFYEDSQGNTIRTLWDWWTFVRGFNDRRGAFKKQYAARNILLHCANTTGAIAYTLILDMVWPIGITASESSEETTPVHHQVRFSVDFIDLDEKSFQENAIKAKG